MTGRRLALAVASLVVLGACSDAGADGTPTAGPSSASGAGTDGGAGPTGSGAPGPAPSPTGPPLAVVAPSPVPPLQVGPITAAPPLERAGGDITSTISRRAVEILGDLDAERIDVDGDISTRVTLPDTVLFGFDEAALRPRAREVLDQLVEVLTEVAPAPVAVGGHTDSSGPDGYNQQLSERRAEAVVQYLRDAGVAARRLTATGYGETQPLEQDGGGAEARARNRRVEVVIEGVDPEG